MEDTTQTELARPQDTMSTPIPQPNLVPPPSAGPSKTFLFILVFVLLAGASAAAYFLGMQNLQPAAQPVTIAPIVIKPTPTVDPTDSWQIYSSKIISFKYPPTYTLEERQKNFIVLLSNPTNPQSVEVSIDARQTGNYANYTQAVTTTKAGLIGVQTETLPDGVKITGTTGPGYGSGQPIAIVLLKHNEATIGVETTTIDTAKLQLFDQILSTFTFVSPTGGTDQTQAIDTSTWKTYIATFDSFSIKYPPFLSIVKDTYNGKVFRIFIQNFNESAGLLPKKTDEDFQLVIQPESLPDATLGSLRKIQEDQGYHTNDYTIDGIPSFKVILPAKDAQQIQITTVHNGKAYNFIIQTATSNYISYLDQILSTFKFTK